MPKTRDELLVIAEKLSALIIQKTKERKKVPLVKNLWYYMYNFFIEKTYKYDEVYPLTPRKGSISEIFLYGLSTENSDYCGNIDMLIFDNGHYSKYFLRHADCTYMNTRELSKKFLEIFMDVFFDIQTKELNNMLDGTTINLRVLPVASLVSRRVYEKISDRRYGFGPFLRVIFPNILHFNSETEKFEIMKPDYLEKKYDLKLEELDQ